MNLLQTFNHLRTLDQRRDSLPGEHWAAFGSGLTLLMRARRQRSGLGRTLALLAGGAMLVRAASGRDGIGKWLGTAQRSPLAGEPRTDRQPASPAAGSLWAREADRSTGLTTSSGGSPAELHQADSRAGSIAARMSGDGLGTEPRPDIDRLALHSSQGLAGAQGSGGGAERGIN